LKDIERYYTLLSGTITSSHTLECHYNYSDCYRMSYRDTGSRASAVPTADSVGPAFFRDSRVIWNIRLMTKLPDYHVCA